MAVKAKVLGKRPQSAQLVRLLVNKILEDLVTTETSTEVYQKEETLVNDNLKVE